MFFKDKQQLIICILAVSLTAGFFLLRYLPVSKKRQVLEKERKIQRLILAQAASDDKKFTELNIKLEQLRKNVNNYERDIPADRDLGDFLQKIVDLMNAHNLKGQRIEPDKEKLISQADETELKAIPLDMQCKGSLGQLFEFYKSLQTLDRLIRIEEVSLKNSPTFTGQVNMQTKAIIYYRPKQEKG